jgi:diguanylate cyclase
MMSSPKASVPTWSSVGRSTLFGTFACVLASVAFNMVVFGDDLRGDLTLRLLISATVLPVLLCVPLFFYFGVRVRGLAIANVRLGRVARTDSLTACLNRGAFTAKVDSWLQDPESPSSGALLMIDADNFKAINDLFGHDVGDEALTIIARSIRAVLRGGDLVGRMGGEEFGVFLPGVGRRQAGQIAERIRQAVSDAVFLPDGNKRRPLTVSIGGAVFAEPTTFADLFRVADQRLYGAKHAGRNLSAVVQVEDHPIIRLRQSA